jgi:uncharacterized protein with FMN-binding domain
MNTKNIVRAGAAALAGLAVAGCTPVPGGAGPTSTGPSTSASQPPSGSQSAPAGPPASAGQYADGEYEATGPYGSQQSSIGVKLTLDGGVVTAVQVTPNATDPTSLDYQKRFAEAVPAVVVGRPIDEINVQKLAGSSGTPVGFNAAVDKIKEAARG